MSPLARPLSVGFPRMHKEAAERRDFLPDIVARLAACGAEVAVERGHRLRDGIPRRGLHVGRRRPRRRRGGCVRPGCRRRPARARVSLRPPPARGGARLDAPLPYPARSGPDARTAAHRRRIPRHGRRRFGAPARGEPRERCLERRRGRLPRPRAHLAGPVDAGALRPARHRSSVPGGSAGMRWRRPPSTATWPGTRPSRGPGSPASRWSPIGRNLTRDAAYLPRAPRRDRPPHRRDPARRRLDADRAQRLARD